MATIKMINTSLVRVASAGCECVLDRFDATKFQRKIFKWWKKIKRNFFFLLLKYRSSGKVLVILGPFFSLYCLLSFVDGIKEGKEVEKEKCVKKMGMEGEKLRIETGGKVTEVKAGLKMMGKRAGVVSVVAVVIVVRKNSSLRIYVHKHLSIFVNLWHIKECLNFEGGRCCHVNAPHLSGSRCLVWMRHLRKNI